MQDRIIDARWLEPPEPMELTLAAIETLVQDERLRLLIHRTPNLLMPILREWGYSYQTNDHEDGTYEILIWREEQLVRH